jgi:uncharacterized protein YcbX
MTQQDGTGRVTSLWRFPVKSMQGDAHAALEVTATGIVGDRAFALFDVERGKLASAKDVKHFPGLLDFHASYVSPPRADVPLPPLRIVFPDGSEVTVAADDAVAADARLSAWFGRTVRLQRADAHVPDGAANAQPLTSIQARVGTELSAALGLEDTVPITPFIDLFPCSLITRATIERLSALAPGSVFDERRFRMNMTLDVAGEGFVENAWPGGRVAIGDSVQLHVAMADPRCALTTLAQPGLALDAEVLRTMNAHNRLPTLIGDQPCAGVYASVLRHGVVRVGDSVCLDMPSG